ncbi:MAG: cold shock and DUF1294 domain-containing protein [Hydrogenophaga sp.]|jgi:uncharacterized membrane protein YsdA (DUF1294 family)/cold shock CspA family protein|nr:cold shock and DUF1294 domain-containing protein [Hydrogenophaga sp.]
MRFTGKLTAWNDDRGFGHIEPAQGGEPVFVHISAWPRGLGRPQLNQAVSFEVEQGPKGKRARAVQPVVSRSAAPQTPRAQTRQRSRQTGTAQWGTTTLLAIPAFVVLFAVVAVLWKLPLWVAGLYVGCSAATFLVYAVDKAAAGRGAWRTPESNLHVLALAGGWPGALVAQQVLRHKSSKRDFRAVFWATVVLNVLGFVVLASPLRGPLLALL